MPRSVFPSTDESFQPANQIDWNAPLQHPEPDPAQRDYEWLVNGDFETGTLSPWYGSFWEIDSFFPHSGNFGAKKLSTSGWAWIRQDFQPIPTADIASVSFWMLNTSFNDSYAYLLYDDSTQTECPLPELLVWDFVDLTAYLAPGKNLNGLKVSHSPGIDDFICLDEVSIMIQSGPNVQVNLDPLNPPIVIPGQGGAFDFNVEVSNLESNPLTLALWILAQAPNLSWIGPIFGPANLTLPGGASLIRLRTQAIPYLAPPGTYTYQLYAGAYPDSIWDSDSFFFERLAQNAVWVASYSGPVNLYEEPADIAVDNEGNVYVTGTNYGIGKDYFTVKYNSAGVEEWSVQYNGPDDDDDLAEALALDQAGNVYVTGASHQLGLPPQFGPTDIVTLKYSPDGILLWEARFNGSQSEYDYPCDLALDSSGNVYVVGMSSVLGQGASYVILKYNPDGVRQWVAFYHEGGDVAYALDVDAEQNVYVTGGSSPPLAGSDCATVKFNSSGEQQWAARYTGVDWDEGRDIAVDLAGNIYVAGSSDQNHVSSYTDFVTIKYDSSGNELWVMRYNGPTNDSDAPAALVLDGAGNVYVTGLSVNQATDWLTLSYSSSGLQSWVQRYSGLGDYEDAAGDIAVDSRGDIYVTGYCTGNYPPYNSNYLTIKYSPMGNQEWASQFNGLPAAEDRAYALAVDDEGGVYVTGYSGSAGYYDVVTVKYSGADAQILGNPAHPSAMEATALNCLRIKSASPNPFNPTTILTFDLPVAGLVRLEVFDINGRLVGAHSPPRRTPPVGFGESDLHWFPAGTHQIPFDGSGLPSGIYLARLTAGEFSAVQKLILLR